MSVLISKKIFLDEKNKSRFEGGGGGGGLIELQTLSVALLGFSTDSFSEHMLIHI